ncbi:diaminopimelate decarboxylase [Enterobacterales bacterium CwR94]|nr:diaminopimelate decarboxylase [Enterobacterales bacterium CwR94]
MWEVNFTEDMEIWLNAQDDALIEDVLASLAVLKMYGPRLGRPWVDHIKGSRFFNMKELRVQSKGRPIRLFFAFNPRRQAIILCGGNKQGQDDALFYRQAIRQADEGYQRHLANGE